MIDLPKIADPRGNLTFIEGNRHVPFDIARDFVPISLVGTGPGRDQFVHFSVVEG